MIKPFYYRKIFDKLEQNMELLDELIKKNPEEYIRRRLKTIKHIWEGKSTAFIKEELSLHQTQFNERVKTLALLGTERGLRALAKKMTKKRGRKLNEDQQSGLRDILDNKKPYDFGYEGNVFTGKILVDIIQKEYNVNISDQGVYNLLKYMGYSYQKAHRDYEKADKEEQREYGEKLKKNTVGDE